MSAANSPETAVYALTRKGGRLGRRLADVLGGSLFTPQRFAADLDATGFERLSELVPQTFQRYRRHLFIAATGLVARVLAPLLTSKATDPAVLVMDQEGRFAISFLSGHLGGANAFAHEIAALTGATPVITTATDAQGLPAVDELARRAGLRVENSERIKRVNAALLEGEQIRVYDPDNWLGLDQPELREHLVLVQTPDESVAVWVDWRAQTPADALILRPPCLCLGMGCRKGVAAAVLERFLRDALQEHNLALGSVWRLASVEAKREEPGLLEAASRLGVELLFFDSERLNAIKTPHVSAKAIQAVGTGSVAEAAALLGAGAETLLVEKIIRDGATLAVAQRRRDA